MAVHCVFVASPGRDGGRIDRALKERFADVHRVGEEVWLVDSARSADQVAALVRPALPAPGRLFVAALTRDTAEQLPPAGRMWLTAPHRGWGERVSGHGEALAGETPFAVAA